MEVLRSAIIPHGGGAADGYDSGGDRSIGGVYGSHGFFFQQRRGHINLRGIAKVNLERMVREVDVDTLQQHIENLTFCNLREEDLRYLTDPQIVKIFRISQLITEYLLYSQDQLVDNMNKLSKKYSSKKKDLAKKRRELTELQESTKSLRNQVKAKKQNIATLEELLKETNRTREKEMRRIKLLKEQQPAAAESADVIRFFVAGPEGLCVEFCEHVSSTVQLLLLEVKKAFISKRDREFEDRDHVVAKLVFRGKLLLPEQTLSASGIRDGDTLMVLIETTSPPPQQQQQQSVDAATPAVDQQQLTQQMLEFLSKQQQESLRELAKDINGGWQSAVETLAGVASRPQQQLSQSQQQLDPQLLSDMNTRWSRAELQLREQLDDLSARQAAAADELNSMSVIAMRRKFLLGELESDQDDNPPPRKADPPQQLQQDNSELYDRINSLTIDNRSTHSELDALRALMLQQAHEMEELKRLLAQRREQTAAAAPVQPQLLQVRKEEQPQQPQRLNKWSVLNDLAAAAPEPVREPEVLKVPAAQVFEQQKVSPKKPKQVTIVEEPPKVQQLPEPAVAPPQFVDVVFPHALNPDLAALSAASSNSWSVSAAPTAAQKLTVTVPFDATVDDLVFEIRNTVATAGRLPFGKVVLNFKGQRVVLGIDLANEDNFTAEAAANFALIGDLKIQLLIGNPVTNAQIDMLLPSMEKLKIFSSSRTSTAAAAFEDTASVGSARSNISRSSAGGSGKLRQSRIKKRNWDDDNNSDDNSNSNNDPVAFQRAEQQEEEQYGPLAAGQISHAMYRKVRGSLDDALSGVSDKEGLTDEELKQQVSKLRNYAGSLPTEVSQHLATFRESVADAMGAVAADSGSETGLSGGEELLLLNSTGKLHPRSERMARQVTQSLRLSRSGAATAQVPGLLRVSSSSTTGAGGGGLGSIAASLALTQGSADDHQQQQLEQQQQVVFRSTSRRSIEQFDQEHMLGDSFLRTKDRTNDDLPMMASINKSSDFQLRSGRKQQHFNNSDLPSHSGFAEATTAAATAAAAEDAEDDDQQLKKQHSQHRDEDVAAVTGDGSLAFSPSVSVSNARSRYSSQHGDESNSDQDDSFKYRNNSSSQLPLDATDESLEEKLRADAKRGTAAESGIRDRASVDSYKKMIASEERKAGGGGGSFKHARDSADSGGYGNGTGELSSIRTFDDTMTSDVDGVVSMTDDDPDRDHLLSQTVDSEGELLLARGRGATSTAAAGSGKNRQAEVQRQADEYERGAAFSNSSTISSAAVEQFSSPPTDSPAGGASRHSNSGKVSEGSNSLFRNLAGGGVGSGGEEDNSVNSFTLSESNNLDEDT